MVAGRFFSALVSSWPVVQANPLLPYSATPQLKSVVASFKTAEVYTLPGQAVFRVYYFQRWGGGDQVGQRQIVSNHSEVICLLNLAILLSSEYNKELYMSVQFVLAVAIGYSMMKPLNSRRVAAKGPRRQEGYKRI